MCLCRISVLWRKVEFLARTFPSISMTSTFTSPAYDSPPRNRRHNRPPVSSSTSTSFVSRRVSVIGCCWMLQCWRLTFYIPPRFHLAGKRRNLTSFYTQVSESCIRPFSVYLRVPTFVTKSIILLTRWNKYVCMACVFRVWFFPWQGLYTSASADYLLSCHYFVCLCA
jgi:hypothetical protein